LIEIIANSHHKNKNVLRIAKPIISCLAKLGDYFRIPINSERLQKLTESYEVSNQKILKAVGKPLPIKTEEGLLQTLKSFKNNRLT
jgi:hypothetical protein